MAVHAPALSSVLTDDVLALFLSKDSPQMREEFIGYLGHEPPLRKHPVPGDSRLHTAASSRAINSTAAIVAWMIELNKRGFSLDGKLKGSDLVIDRMGHVRGKYELTHKLYKVSAAGTLNDMASVSKIIKSDVYQCVQNQLPADMPVDIVHLLSLLDKFQPNYPELLIMHVSNETEPAKCALTMRFFNRLQQIRQMDPTKYNTIIGKVDVGQNWIANAMLNSHLHYMLRYDHSNMKDLELKIRQFLVSDVCYRPTKEAFLTCRRNGEGHLLRDYSIDLGQGIEPALKAAEAAMVSQNGLLAPILKMPRPQSWQGIWGVAQQATDPTIHLYAAGPIGEAIKDALSKPYLSEEIATKAAVAAARRIAADPLPWSQQAKAAAETAARTAAVTATTVYRRANPVPHPLPKKLENREMFSQHHIEHMFSLAAPNMLHTLQFAMFEAGELSDGSWGHKSWEICLLPA